MTTRARSPSKKAKSSGEECSAATEVDTESPGHALAIR